MKHKNRKVLLALILPVLALSSCATSYQREGIFTNGYTDSRIAIDTFVVIFRANEHTPSKKVTRYAIRRAAEVTLQHGYRYFAILDQRDSSGGKRIGKKTSASHLYYPSLQLTIQCFHTRPLGLDVLDARERA